MTDTPPDPTGLHTVEQVSDYLRQLRAWAGHISYPELVRRINTARPPDAAARQTTVYDCFRAGRTRLDADLVRDIAVALGLHGHRLEALRQALSVAHGQAEAADVAQVLPFLPDPSPRFTGRGAEMSTIIDHLADGAAVVAIVGPAGVGKTELALAAAHRLPRPPHTQLFADLHGFDNDRPPVPPRAVLAGLLRQLGVPDEQIYRRRDLDQRAALLRHIMAERDAILLLDNAASEEQLSHLVPGGGCRVLVTSRQRLIATEDRAVVPLGRLPVPEALELLRRFDPEGRVDADPHPARRLADELCFGLPLDLVALGSRLADPDDAHWSLTDHVTRLASFPADEVSRPALAATYHRMPATARRVLRLLVTHPGSDVTRYDVTALANLPLEAAADALARLHDGHLLRQRRPGRYSLHDAVRAYADRLSRDRDPQRDRDAASDRLMWFYRAAVEHAMDYLRPPAASRTSGTRQPDTLATTIQVPTFADPAAAKAWLDEQRGHVLAVAAMAAERGRFDHVAAVARALPRYLDPGGHWLEAQQLHLWASRTDDPAERAGALVDLGSVRFRLANYRQAGAHFAEALALFRRQADRAGQGRALHGLASVRYRTGRHDRARHTWRRALAAFRHTGNQQNEAAVLVNLGVLETEQRHVDLALECHQQALAIFRALGDRAMEALTLANIGTSCLIGERYGAAEDHLRRALTLARETGNRSSEANALRAWGRLHRHLGQNRYALRRHREALAVYRTIGDPDGEASMRNEIAITLRGMGHGDLAMGWHLAALAQAEPAELRHELARAHAGVAALLTDRGAVADAADHWKQAWELFDELGLPDADDVAAQLS